MGGGIGHVLNWCVHWFCIGLHWFVLFLQLVGLHWFALACMRFHVFHWFAFVVCVAVHWHWFALVWFPAIRVAKFSTYKLAVRSPVKPRPPAIKASYKIKRMPAGHLFGQNQILMKALDTPILANCKESRSGHYGTSPGASNPKIRNTNWKCP